MFAIQLVAYMVMYLQTEDIRMLGFYLMQVVLFGATILLYTNIYPKVSRLVVNNMCMLLCIGMIMLTRLDYENAVKQYVIAAGAIALSLVVPVIIRKFKLLSEWRTFYGVAGLFSLAIVVVIGQVSYGAMLGFSIGGISVQPSEVVKIIFVFFVASSFKKSLEFRNIVITTAVAAFHVLILVISRDLGAALIISSYIWPCCTWQPGSRFMYWPAWGREVWRRWRLIIYSAMSGPVSLSGGIRLRLMTTAGIRWPSPCLRSAPEAGLEWDFFRGSRIRSQWHRRTLSSLPLRKRWGSFLHSVSYWSASVSILCFEYCHAAEEHVL